MRKEKEDIIIKDQTKSLDVWLDYLLSEDAKFYPNYLKYWALQGMLSLGKYDTKTGEFERRSQNTANTFADLNSEALPLTISIMDMHLNEKKLSEDSSLNILIKKGSFRKIYGYFLKKVIKQDIANSDDGIWIKYNRGQDHLPLVNSLIGKGTEWCIVGEAIAEKQLSEGDFYVYYTKDNQWNYTVPRVVIRMEGSSIREIRGITEDQNIEPDMADVVEDKLKEFYDADEYKKKVSDMKRMTEIYKKFRSKEKLTKEELKFLYEVDDKIIGFGYSEDPRIKEIISTRNIKKDLVYILDCSSEEIGLEEKDIHKGIRLKYYYGDLDLRNLTSTDGLTLPE